jgi:hypothetical protein
MDSAEAFTGGTAELIDSWKSLILRSLRVVARDGIGPSPLIDSTQLIDSEYNTDGPDSQVRHSLAQNWHNSLSKTTPSPPSLGNKKRRTGRRHEGVRVVEQDQCN